MKSTLLTILCLLWAPVALGESGARGDACRVPTVAVVGAGATGLTTAYLLEQRGYRVTVFEKECEVGGFARTRFVEGKAFDLATMFVPGSSIAGHGVEPLLNELIQVSAEPLVPAVDFETLVATAEGNVVSELPLPVFAACSTPKAAAECARQLLHGFSLQSRYMQCLADGLDLVACGLVEPEHPDENLIEWGERHGISLFVQLLLYTADGLGATGT